MIVATADGTSERILATRKRPAYYAMTMLSWSHDGKRLAVAAATLTGGLRMQIATIDVETGVEKLIGAQIFPQNK